MAYENNGHVYNLDTIEPVGDKGEPGDKGVKGYAGDKGTDEIIANIETPIDDFLSNGYPNDIGFLTATLRGSGGDPAGDMRTGWFSFKPEDVIYWRMVSGSLGKFTNPRMVYDDVYKQTYFIANWSGATSSLVSYYCLFEILVRYPN
ncbi:MAG: hypothetical protein EOM50_04940 [Erysipelotrichia bacterium]|nr:hypothetical protein [Erysipelotrichia bacterium]